jgi:hypothetical protein
MIRKKKWRSDFYLSRAAVDNAHVIETQLPMGHQINYPFFEGMYSINVSHDIDSEGAHSLFLENNRRVRGFVETSGVKRVDLTGRRKKIVKTISSSVYHFFADDVCDILYALKVYPDAEVILDISLVEGALSDNSRSFLGFFFDALKDQGIKHKLVDVSKFDIIYINDFVVAESAYRSSLSGTMIYDFFKKYINDISIEPHRSVYLTRSKVQKDTASLDKSSARLSFNSDQRVDSETELAETFSKLGYEIVAPEDFKDFEEQLNFFNSVKTLASLTSSGLSNALFMQPGGNIIEISTPLVVVSPMLAGEKSVVDMQDQGDVVTAIAQELHMFYKLIAYLKGHSYLSINNPNRSAKELELSIKSNQKVLEFMDNNDKSNNL